VNNDERKRLRDVVRNHTVRVHTELCWATNQPVSLWRAVFSELSTDAVDSLRLKVLIERKRRVSARCVRLAQQATQQKEEE